MSSKIRTAKYKTETEIKTRPDPIWLLKILMPRNRHKKAQIKLAGTKMPSVSIGTLCANIPKTMNNAGSNSKM